MGIQGARFYYHHELPRVNSIKNKFEEITGLKLTYTSCLELNELVTDERDYLMLLEQSINGDNTHSNRSAHFSCENFENVYLGEYMVPSSKSFYLECGIQIENMYFFHALSKTMLELGGNFFDYNVYPHEDSLKVEDYLKPYYPYERRWKNIKKWHEMNTIEQAFFRSHYVKHHENRD